MRYIRGVENLPIRVSMLVEVLSRHQRLQMIEIFLCNVLTKEHLPASLLPLAREEYGKVVARVLQHNRRDAWELAADNELKQKARRAWIEFFMFGKCVLRQAQRGKRPAQAYHFTQSAVSMAGWRSIWLVDRGRCRFRPTVSWQKGKGAGRGVSRG